MNYIQVNDGNPVLPLGTPVELPVKLQLNGVYDIAVPLDVVVFNTDNPTEEYNLGNSDSSDAYDWYKQITVLTSPNYSMKNNTTPLVGCTATGPFLVFPITFPANSTVPTN